MRPPANLARPWRVRAAQLDLARQRETLESIGQYIRFIQRWGYNSLLLYLEGVVRTKSFPYRPARQSYAPDDMRHIVRVAEQAGIEVIPCVSTLGHVEHFLECKQLQQLREGPSKGRHMFCPSNPTVYEFLERYLREIAALFPSQHFHIGCDESWALGSCPVCRARIRKGESNEDLLLRHILRVRSILEQLGKRTWIWDDMFENASEAKLREIPRDVVLCAWHYGSELLDQGSLPGHFNQLRRRDWFTFYEANGFDVVVCPWARSVENTLDLTRAARPHRVLGGLQTVWELGHSFLPGILPGVALAGALWSNPRRPSEEVFQETLAELFPSAEPFVLDVLRSALTDPPWQQAAGPEYHLRGPLTLEERRALHGLVVSERVIGEQLDASGACIERDMLEEMHVLLRLQLLAGREREVLPALVDPRVPAADRAVLRKQAQWCIRELGDLAGLRAKQWKRHRPGIGPDRASALLRDRKKALAAFLRAAEQTTALLNVRLFLWDSYSAPRLRIELHAKEGWQAVRDTSFKPVNHRDALYMLQVPIRWKGADPRRLRFTVSGFGGQGVSYGELHFADRTLVPSAVGTKHGRVSNPRAMLKDDSSVCFLGHTDTVSTLRQHRDNEESSIEVVLARKGTLSDPQP